MAHRTALVLLFPRANEALAGLRARYFRNLERRMPAHVTMLFPFRSALDDATLAMVADVSAGLHPFEATFRDVGRFRRDVVWLHPEPDDEFERVSDAVLAAFPDCAPYGGTHSGRTLHLTVASRLRGKEASHLAREAASVVPLTERIDEMTLMVETGNGWAVEQSWPLGPGSPPALNPN